MPMLEYDAITDLDAVEAEDMFAADVVRVVGPVATHSTVLVVARLPANT